MAVKHDYYCRTCDREVEDVWTDSVPECCGIEMRILMPRLMSFEWGGPRTYIHMRDESFSSRSELDSWAKKRGYALGEASEKVGGARNDENEGLGKTYSYNGASRKNNPLAG